MSTSSKALGQTLRRYSNSAKRPIHLAWLMSLLSTLLFIAQSWLLAKMFAHWLYAFAHEQAIDPSVFTNLLPWLIACLLLRPVFNFVKEKLAFNAGLQASKHLRQTVLSKIEQLGTARYQYGSDGSLASSVIEQADALQGYVSRFYLQRLIIITTPIVLLIATASQSLMAAMILLLTAPLVPIFMILIGHATARKSREQFAAMARLSGCFLDWLRGTATLQRLQAVDMARDDIELASDAYRKHTMSVLKIAFLNTAALELLGALSIALIAVYLGFGLIGILPWQKNVVPVAYQAALFILLLAPEFYAPLRQLGADYHVKAQAEGAIERLLPILEFNCIHTTEDSQLFTLTASPKLTFYDVSVKANERIRLAPLSFSVNHGESVAIIGESGSGKSTLLQILLGFCRYQGDIKVNGQDFANINHEQFRTQIAYLSQQTMLLPMSIADNLRLVNADVTDNELWQVLAKVGLKGLIERLPNGLATMLGERGSGLSGGQQRRLAIAQLLLQNSYFWLLDEPTEHLDLDTKTEINTLLQQVTQGKTVLWVTHDPHTLTWLDKHIQLTPQHTLGGQNGK